MRSIERLFKLAAAGLVAVSLLPFAAELSWVLELTSHFRVQYLASSLVLLAWLAARRELGWCVALGVCATVNAVPLLGYLPTGSEARGASAVTLDVMSVNVSFRDYPAEPLLAMLREQAPDLVVVEELTPRRAADLRTLDALFPHRLEQPEQGAFGIGLRSRHPLESAELFMLGTTAAVEARVRTPAGPVTVIGVHLRPPTSRAWAAERNRQLERLAERVAGIDEPLVVLGDFNITPYSPYFAAWLERTGLEDTRRGRNVSRSWPTFLPILGIPIDHVAVSDEFRVIAHRRLSAFGSDHYPVLARLDLDPHRDANDD